MPQGIEHHPLTGNTAAIPGGHTRVCHAGAWGAATRIVLQSWRREDYYDAHGVSPAAEQAITEMAWDGITDGTLCGCAKKKPRRG